MSNRFAGLQKQNRPSTPSKLLTRSQGGRSTAVGAPKHSQWKSVDFLAWEIWSSKWVKRRIALEPCKCTSYPLQVLQCLLFSFAWLSFPFSPEVLRRTEHLKRIFAKRLAASRVLWKECFLHSVSLSSVLKPLFYLESRRLNSPHLKSHLWPLKTKNFSRCSELHSDSDFQLESFKIANQKAKKVWRYRDMELSWEISS